MKPTSKTIRVLGLGSLLAISFLFAWFPTRFVYALTEIGPPTGSEETEDGRYLGDPIRGLTPEQRRAFDEGFDLFIKNWTVKEGIGPKLNAHSCVTCHRIPTPGGSGTGPETFVLHSHNVIDAIGGSVFTQFEVGETGNLLRLSPPRQITLRKTQSLFGLGLLESVPVSVLLEHSDPDDRDCNGISGRLVKVGPEYGRFGWKGNVPSIQMFVEDAFAVELGLGNLSHRDESKLSIRALENVAGVEINATQVGLVSEFVRYLGPPRHSSGKGVARGSEIFDKIDCATCHRRTLRTAPGAFPFGNQTLFAFTDLLLHDMGDQLADGLEENGVSAREFRTPPLWGIASTGPPYLHDGRAATLNDAILAHGGEASISAHKYEMLSADQREAILKFINSL